MKISITYGWNSSEERAKNLPYTSMFPKTKFNENLGISLYKRNGYDKIDDIKFYKFDYEELSEMDMKKELSKMFEGKGIAEINKIVKQLEVLEYFGVFPKLEMRFRECENQTKEEILQGLIREIHEKDERGHLIPESLL